MSAYENIIKMQNIEAEFGVLFEAIVGKNEQVKFRGSLEMYVDINCRKYYFNKVEYLLMRAIREHMNLIMLTMQKNVIAAKKEAMQELKEEYQKLFSEQST